MIPTPPPGGVPTGSEGAGPGVPPPPVSWAPVPPSPDARHRPRSLSTLLTVLIVVAGCYLTGLAVNNLSASGAAGLVDAVFPHFGHNRVDTASISRAWDVIQQEYVIRDVSTTMGTQGAENGLIEALRAKYNDRFSAFYTSDQYANLKRDLSGRRNGSVGITLEARCDGATLCPASTTPTVVAIEDVLKNQPADHAGLRNGDILVSVGGKTVSSLGPDATTRLNAVGPLIRGAAGTPVTLVVQRAAQQVTVTVTRADLQIPAAYSQKLGSVLYLQITAFDENIGESLRGLLQDGLKGGVTGIVLDLRHNPGGLVTEAQSTASEFLTPKTGVEEDVLVRRGRLGPGGNPTSAQYVQRDRIESGGLALTQPMAVLIDGSSASAAEIVASALHDYHRATLVGDKSFGKGSVQQDFSLPDGADLHLTVEKWFGPGGETIDGTGITPDLAAGLPDDDHRFHLDAQSPPASTDAQLQAALTALSKKA
ncbi:MAG: S41 family peptidase [Chloroflexi bacterium]|nr:MAG: S41 family peptidase [Chloroflexota bacterium]